MTDSELIKTAAALLRSVSALSNLVMDDNERMKANSACIARDVGAALEDSHCVNTTGNHFAD